MRRLPEVTIPRLYLNLTVEVKVKRLLTILGTALVLTGCDSDTPFSPQFDMTRAGSPALNTVSYNVYWGARVEDLLTVEPSQIPIVAAMLWGDVQMTNFPERAAAIAELIEASDAHVVGLQEIALFRYEPQSDYSGGELPPPDAEIVLLDFLDVLNAALQARGLHYSAASKSENMDIELPMCTDAEVCFPLADIRLTDYDVILVRDDVEWDNPADGNFAAQLPVEVGTQVIFKPSGWASVDIRFQDNQYRFVNTHLEPADVLPGGEVHPGIALIQAGQLAELKGIVEASPFPVILVGDMNSDDDGGTTPTYQALTDMGFVDAWVVGQPRGAGYTSNQAPDLMNAMSELSHRIDFVLYRDEFTTASGHFRGSVSAELLGEEQADRTVSGLWPSDHAGVAATLRIAPGSPD